MNLFSYRCLAVVASLALATPAFAQATATPDGATAGQAAAAAAPGGVNGVAGPVVGSPARLAVPPHPMRKHHRHHKKM